MPGYPAGYFKSRGMRVRKVWKAGQSKPTWRRKLRRGPTTGLAKAITTVINRKTETKYIGQWLTTSAMPTGVAPFTGPKWQNVVQPLGVTNNWCVALPAQAEIETPFGRDGIRIEPLSHRVKMTLRIAPGYTGTGPFQFNAQQVPLDVTAYIFYGYIPSLKTYQGSAASTLVQNTVCVTGQNEAQRAYGHLLENGDNTFTPFTGDPALAQLPMSKYVNMKVMKLHYRQGYGWINTASGLVGDNTPVPNTDSQNTLSKTVTLKFKPPAKLLYKTSTDIYPENYAPVYGVAYVYNDALGFQAVPAGNPGALEYVAQAQMWFKDHA